MNCKYVETKTGKFLFERDQQPCCGDFCDSCGSCLHCEGEDACMFNANHKHLWVRYVDSENSVATLKRVQAEFDAISKLADQASKSFIGLGNMLTALKDIIGEKK